MFSQRKQDGVQIMSCRYSEYKVTAKLKAPPSGLSRHTGGVVEIATAHGIVDVFPSRSLTSDKISSKVIVMRVCQMTLDT